MSGLTFSTPILACAALPWSVMTIQSRPYAWRVLRLVDDPVHAVAAVLRVDVVVAGEPGQAAGLAAVVRRPGGLGAALGGLGGRAGCADAEDARGRGARAEQARVAQEAAPAQVAGRQLAVRGGQVERGRQVGIVVVMVVVAVAHQVSPLVCVSAHTFAGLTKQRVNGVRPPGQPRR